MNDNRLHAASTVFEGRVVIAGGYNDDGILRTVEAYDHVADEWSYMPSMINESYKHNMIAISNKLFAIGCSRTFNICEVYDTFCKKFVVFNSHPTIFDHINHKSITFSRKIMVIKNCSSKVAIYDSDKNEWFKESSKITNDIWNFYCIKIPSLNF